MRRTNVSSLTGGFGVTVAILQCAERSESISAAAFCVCPGVSAAKAGVATTMMAIRMARIMGGKMGLEMGRKVVLAVA